MSVADTVSAMEKSRWERRLLRVVSTSVEGHRDAAVAQIDNQSVLPVVVDQCCVSAGWIDVDAWGWCLAELCGRFGRELDLHLPIDASGLGIENPEQPLAELQLRIRQPPPLHRSQPVQAGRQPGERLCGAQPTLNDPRTGHTPNLDKTTDSPAPRSTPRMCALREDRNAETCCDTGLLKGTER